MSNYAETAYVKAAEEIGVSGYVLKGRVQTELIPAIHTAMAGAGLKYEQRGAKA